MEIKPRRELPRIGKFKEISTAPLIDLGTSLAHGEPQPPPEPKLEPPPGLAVSTEPNITVQPSDNEPKLNILGFEVIERQSPQNLDQTWDLKQTSSLELLTPSPLGFTPFDSRSIDELMTPDDFGADQLPPGLSNINYDIDLSDFSGDNSIAEDAPKSDPKDPFSPEALKKPTFDPFAPQTSRGYETGLDSFDEFSFVDQRKQETDPFEVVHKGQDPFSPVDIAKDPFFSPQKQSTSILDDHDSPTSGCLLPSPMQPQSSGKPS